MELQDRETFQKASTIFKQHGGLLRTTDALRAGIHPRTLYAMRDSGFLEQIARGLYRLSDMPALGNPDVVSVALKVQGGVICLISALAFHEITTQIPHEVYVALDRGAREPHLAYPPLRMFRFGGKAFKEGVEVHELDGVSVRIYGPEKTLADCFKCRNKIGMDTAIEALKLYRHRKRIKVEDILKFAHICRVERVMRPYLEAIL
jgi:predicted transcriptional regulator of viral defense system